MNDLEKRIAEYADALRRCRDQVHKELELSRVPSDSTLWHMYTAEERAYGHALALLHICTDGIHGETWRQQRTNGVL
jgi:hypothetical protein